MARTWPPAKSTLRQPCSSPQKYQYTALPVNISSPNIRVAELLPGTYRDTVKCELQTVSLGHAYPPYKAVSYTWGSNERTKTVVCNGRQLLVTENLFIALSRLRTKDSSIPIWIDQLCINQDDNTECENQVRIMGRIYKNAQQVIIWLGETQEKSAEAIALCKKVIKMIEAQKPDVARDIVSHPERLGLPRWRHDTWYHLGLLLRRPWFERSWTIQEVVMARDAIVQCGKDCIPWRTLSTIASVLDFETGRPSGVSNPSSTSLTHRVRLIDRLSTSPLNLIDLLFETRDYRASDPRDKVYAFLDLAVSEILPDYTTMTAERLYVLVAVQHLMKTLSEPGSEQLRSRKIMNLVSNAGLANQQLPLPSWVADWSTGLQSRRFVLHPLVSTDPVPGYKAGGPALSHFDIVARHRLRLSAIICDSVHTVGTKWLPRGDKLDRRQLRDNANEWLAEATRINYSAGHTYLTGGPTNEIFRQTICANRDRYGNIPSPKNIQEMYNGWGILERRALTLDYFKEGVHGDQWLYFHATMAAQGRVFMLSTHRYTGLVPHGTRCGDKIAVLLGAGAPVVLRPVGYDMDGHSYSLVGEAYIRGIMDGEVIENLVFKDSKIEDIVLV